MSTLTAPAPVVCRVGEHATGYERVLRRLAAALDAYALRRAQRRADRRELECARAAADERRRVSEACLALRLLP